MMRKIVELKERGFADKDLYDFAPEDFEDAMDSYRRVLEITGDVCGEDSGQCRGCGSRKVPAW